MSRVQHVQSRFSYIATIRPLSGFAVAFGKLHPAPRTTKSPNNIEGRIEKTFRVRGGWCTFRVLPGVNLYRSLPYLATIPPWDRSDKDTCQFRPQSEMSVKNAPRPIFGWLSDASSSLDDSTMDVATPTI